MTFSSPTVQTWMLAVGFLSLALMVLPIRRLRSTSLRLVAGATRVGLLLLIAGAFVVTVWPDAQVWPATLVVWTGWAELATNAIHTVPLTGWIYLAVALVVALVQPILGYLDFACWVSEAADELTARAKAQTRMQVDKPTVASAVSRKELEVAMNAMTRAAEGSRPQQNGHRTLAEVIQR